MPVSRARSAPSPICQVHGAGTVKNRLAVKAHQGDLVGPKAGLGQKRQDRFGMGLRHLAFGVADGMRHGGASATCRATSSASFSSARVFSS